MIIQPTQTFLVRGNSSNGNMSLTTFPWETKEFFLSLCMCVLFKLRCNLFFPESPQLLSVEKRSDVKRICTAPCTTARQVIGLTRPLAKAAGKVEARDIIWSGHRGEAKDGQGLVPAQKNQCKKLGNLVGEWGKQKLGWSCFFFQSF